MKLVKQQGNQDCGIACVAMLANKKYGKVIKDIKGKFDSKERTYLEDIRKILKLYRLRVQNKRKTGKKPKENALVAINYDKESGEWHWVVFDKKTNTILDPNPDLKNNYRNIQNVKLYYYVYVR